MAAGLLSIDDETLTYLHSCISTKRHQVATPETPAYLDAFRRITGQPLSEIVTKKRRSVMSCGMA